MCFFSIPCMRFGQSLVRTWFLNREPSGTVTPLQILKTVDRYTRGAGCELQQSGLLLRVPTTYALWNKISNILGVKEFITYSPKVPNDLILLGVPSVVCMLLPVFNINVCDASNEQFQFTFIEDVDEIWWDELVEAGNKCVELFFYSLLDSPLGDKPATGQPRIKERNNFGISYSMYSFLFSFVTSMFLPLGFKSIVWISPKLSSSVENVGSITPSISFSLSRY